MSYYSMKAIYFSRHKNCKTWFTCRRNRAIQISNLYGHNSWHSCPYYLCRSDTRYVNYHRLLYLSGRVHSIRPRIMPRSSLGTAVLVVSGTNLRPTGPAFAGTRDPCIHILYTYLRSRNSRLFSELNRRRSAGSAVCLGARSTGDRVSNNAMPVGPFLPLCPHSSSRFAFLFACRTRDSVDRTLSNLAPNLFRERLHNP